MTRTLAGVAVALALFATACGGGSSAETATTAATTDETTSAAAPTTIPEAEASLIATTVDGAQIDFGDLEGQDVVLWFWAPW